MFFSQNLLLKFQAGALLGRVMGGNQHVTKISLPVFSLSNKFILGLAIHVINFFVRPLRGPSGDQPMRPHGRNGGNKQTRCVSP